MDLKVWFMRGGFILEGNVAIHAVFSRGLLLDRRDSWNDYRHEVRPSQTVVIKYLADRFLDEGSYFGETVEQTREVRERYLDPPLLAGFSVLCPYGSQVSYRVFLRRAIEGVRGPRLMSEVFKGCSCVQ